MTFDPSISPDGKYVAFIKSNQMITNIFIIPIEGGQIKQLTFLSAFNRYPIWSPDGKYIAFGSNQKGKCKVWRIPSAGGTPRPYDNSELSVSYEMAWSPNFDILYQRPGNRNYHFINFKTEEERTLVKNNTSGWMFHPCFSPDGKKLAVFWNRELQRGIWQISLDDSSQVLLKEGHYRPIVWSSNGKWIYYYDDTKPTEIQIIPAVGGESKKYTTIPNRNENEIAFRLGLAMSPDGKKIVWTVQERKSDIWLMENFDPEVE